MFEKKSLVSFLKRALLITNKIKNKNHNIRDIKEEIKILDIWKNLEEGALQFKKTYMSYQIAFGFRS